MKKTMDPPGNSSGDGLADVWRVGFFGGDSPNAAPDIDLDPASFRTVATATSSNTGDGGEEAITAVDASGVRGFYNIEISGQQ